MIAQDSRGRDPLITFRVGDRLDALDSGRQVEAERIADHRPFYLTYEGPVSQGRGTVTRLAEGEVASIQLRPDGWRMEIQWRDCGAASGAGMRRQLLRVGRPDGGESWVIEVLDAS